MPWRPPDSDVHFGDRGSIRPYLLRLFYEVTATFQPNS